MKIPLTQNFYALVDKEDCALVSKYSWRIYKNTYAIRTDRSNGKPKTILMHREILGNPKYFIDHKDRNGLNNQRYNLRKATHRQNLLNRSKQINNKSGFKGVSWCSQRNKWRSCIKANGKQMHLGYFAVKLHAVVIYNKHAKKYFGRFAFLNTL